MKCNNCGTELSDVKAPCPTCGNLMESKEDMDTIIANIFEEDSYTPKFETAPKDRGTPEKASLVKTATPLKKVEKKAEAPKKPKVANGTKNGAVKTNGQTTAKGPAPTKSSKSRMSENIVTGLRYALAAVILIFTVSMFFNWFTLKGNAVNYGMVRTEEVIPYMYEDIAGRSLEALESYDGPVVVFSAMDLFTFGRRASEAYGTVTGPSGAKVKSIVGIIQKYYMQAVMLIFIINVLCIGLVLGMKSLKTMAMVRNLSVVNLVIIGLNYLALKVTWFSMFAVKAKDLLNQNEGHHQISTAMEGILYDNSVYRYEMFHERGFVLAVFMLVLWLFIGIILAEVKSRRDEIAIEKGDLK